MGFSAELLKKTIMHIVYGAVVSNVDNFWSLIEYFWNSSWAGKLA